MNDRGLDLSPTDVLKADIIGAISPDRRDRYTQIWEQIEEDLGRESFRDLFAHIRMIRRRAKLAETLEAEFEKYVRPADDPQGFIEDTLTPMSDAYLRIINEDFGETTKGSEINRSLRHLAMIDNADWQPPAIQYIAMHANDPTSVATFLSALNVLAFGMFIGRYNVNRRLARYAQVIRSIQDSDDLLAQGSVMYLSQEEKQAVLSQLEGPVYEIPRIRKPVLLRIAEEVSDGSASYDHKIVEHR